jgi:CheY-like chemotaxis protein
VRICQVVANLLTNAIKYSSDGAGIEVRLESLPGEARLSVRDHGAGIDPQLLSQIFDQFLQGDRSLDRLDGGLGIGLTVVRHVVEMHGGRVEASSEGLGRGSEFRVYLPRVDASAESPARAPQGLNGQGRKRRVMVVDDNVDAGESLRELLRLSGHEVAVARDGAQALDQLDDFRADVVLLDLALPRMDGYMVAHAIRARFFNVYPRPRLLALSGFARDEDRQSALRSGFDGYLCKPVEPELMLRVIAGENHWHTSASELG